MPIYRSIPVAAAEARRYRTSATDPFGYPVQRFQNDQRYPCRHCLTEATASAGMLLLSHRTPRPDSFYGHPTAIFLCADDCPGYDTPDRLPDIVLNRVVSFRAFGADGMMIYDASAIVDGGDHDAVLRRILGRSDVAYVNAHTAKAGCFLCHIARA